MKVLRRSGRTTQPKTTSSSTRTNIKQSIREQNFARLSLENVTIFRGKQNVLKGISCNFESPLTLILGANGSGKTSLMHAILGLVAFSGQISIQNTNLARFSKRELAKMMAFVPQLFNVLPKISVKDYIMLGRFPYLPWMGQFSKRELDYTDQQIELLSIGHLSGKLVSQLSGGELRKVAIARALVQDSPILLMDEPLQGLDPFQRTEFYKVMESLLNEGKQLIIVSHEKEVLEKFQPHILALKEKELWFEGPFREIPENWVNQLYAS